MAPRKNAAAGSGAQVTEKIEQVDFVKESVSAFVSYGNYVNYSRHIPSVYDGMKPVHRRIVYGMWQVGSKPGTKHMKSSRIVGEVMGKYHPHGDASTYQTMVNMAQPFTYRLPLIDGHGNWGDIGIGAAAPRYTECRLDANAAALLGRLPSDESAIAEVQEDSVPFGPNYDNTLEQPLVLPAMFPNYVVNASSGMGLGIGQSTAPHNLKEVLDAAIYLVDSPNARVSTLMELLPGPDIPMNCDIFDRDTEEYGIRSYLTTGYGSFTMRAKWEIEEYKVSARKKGKRIVFVGLPYQVSTEMVTKGIADMIESGRLDPSIQVYDNSDSSGVRVVVDIGELDEDDTVQRLLYNSGSTTKLQMNYSVNMNAIIDDLVDGTDAEDGDAQVQIVQVGVFDAIRHWITHRRRVVRRQSAYRKSKAEARLHLVEGYLVAIPIADKIVEVVRTSANRDKARQSMMTKWKFSEIQANSILDMSIGRITKLGADQFIEEKDDLLRMIARCDELLSSEKALNNHLKSQMRRVQKELGTPRMSTLVEGSARIEKPEAEAIEVPVQNGTLIRTHNGRLRWVSRFTGVSPLEGDAVVAVDALDTSCTVECITSFGYHSRVSVEDVPKNLTNAKVIFQDSLSPGEDIVLVRSGDTEELGEADLVLVTQNGAVKRLSYEEWNSKHSMKRVTECLTLDDGDLVQEAFFLPEGSDIVIGTPSRVIRLDADKILPKGRKARALPAIKMDEDDHILFAGPAYDGYAGVLFWTDQDYAGVFPVDDVPYQSRNARGTAYLSAQVGGVVGARIVQDVTAESVLVHYIDDEGESVEEVVPVKTIKPNKRSLTQIKGIASSAITYHDEPEYEEVEEEDIEIEE